MMKKMEFKEASFENPHIDSNDNMMEGEEDNEEYDTFLENISYVPPFGKLPAPKFFNQTLQAIMSQNSDLYNWIKCLYSDGGQELEAAIAKAGNY
mmetsp:Transcript_24527/g.21771  ORF Transcript_24527/g.21771 Transcript_24527/m.21771 type:complete len:95 (+) Transcript_24527:2149-2433(+)